ncbi:MAG: 50S ribosomal protein L3 [Legionellaceae bacterium]
MAIGLVGRKVGMSRVFTEDGYSIPVTVIEIPSNRITQIKSDDTDGYNAIQVTAGTVKRSRVSKPLLGHYAKAEVEPGLGLWEFSVDDNADISSLGYSIGSELTVNLFEEGEEVDVSGITKGKGFAGTVKRHNFSMGDATHGNSLSHRAPGSIGQRQSPGRVFKGKKMSGQMGNKKRTIQSQVLVKIDEKNNLLFIKGGIPGAPGGVVMVSPAVKAKKAGEK